MWEELKQGNFVKPGTREAAAAIAKKYEHGEL